MGCGRGSTKRTIDLDPPDPGDGHMSEPTHWPRHIGYALMALEIDPFAADTYIAGFIQRWGAFDHSALERAFSQGAEDDRLFAINGLGHLGTPEAHALLLPALQSPHPQE